MTDIALQPTATTASPDEVERRRALGRMKLVATSLLVFAALVFVVTTLADDGSTWIGYVRAIAEAAMVGALADWFAVTALFRHPLGLKIPHTAIIPNRKDQIGRSLGTFVESNFLTADVIDQRLHQAEIGRRAGEWLADSAHAARAGEAVGDALHGGLEVLDDDEIQLGVEHFVEARIQATDLAQLLGRAIKLTVEGGHHQRLLDAIMLGGRSFLEDNRLVFRRRLYQESPWWVPEGIDDRVFEKIYTALNNFVDDVHSSPQHEVRSAVDHHVGNFAERLLHDPALRAKGEELKQELLAHPEFRRWIDSLWGEAKQAMLEATDDPDSELRQRMAASLQRLGVRLATEPELQRKVDDWASTAVTHVVANYRTEVSEIIESTVAKWDADATSDKLELQVGRDLQFIRINGTIVGGLAGFVIHAVGELL